MSQAPNFENYDNSTRNSSDSLYGTSGTNEIRMGNGANTVDGRGGDDDIYGNGGNDDLNGGAGADSLFGGTGTDLISGGAGVDALNGEDGNDTLNGNGDGDQLKGGTGADTLNGGDGDDLLNGGAGRDDVDGGAGDDFIYFYDGEVFDDVDGGLGTDSITASASLSGSPVSVSITADFRNGTISGVGATVNVVNVENFYGGAAADTIYSDGSGEFYGQDGDDYIFAGLGTSEVLDGGNGIDTVDTTSWSGAYELNLETGVTNYAPESYVNFENAITGVGDDEVIGTDAANIITTGAGRDTIFAQDGNDELDGGDGNDVITGGAGADIIDGGFGFDTAGYVFSSAGVEVSLTTGMGSGGDAQGDMLSGIERLLGSAFNDILEGDGSSDRLEGRNGDDKIFGLDGNDTLIGGAGGDVIDGGAGFDVAFYNSSASGVVVNLATNINTGGDAAGDELFNVERLVGSSFNDNLAGTGGTDWFEGGDGADVLSMGGGNDLIFGGLGGDTIDGGAGRDNLYYTRSSAAVSVNLTTGNGTGGEAAGDFITDVENVVGSTFGDTLIGGTQINNLQGRDGNDTIGGGANDDILYGGSGNDTFLFETGYDIDRVRDFQNGTDQFDVSDFGLSQAQVVGLAATFGTSVLINFGGGDRLIIENTNLAEIDAGDFIV